MDTKGLAEALSWTSLNNYTNRAAEDSQAVTGSWPLVESAAEKGMSISLRYLGLISEASWQPGVSPAICCRLQTLDRHPSTPGTVSNKGSSNTAPMVQSPLIDRIQDNTDAMTEVPLSIGKVMALTSAPRITLIALMLCHCHLKQHL